MIRWVCAQDPVDHPERRRMRALGDDTIANEDRLARARFRRRLTRQYVRQELHRLEVAAQPAHIGLGDDFGAAETRLTWRERARHREHRRRRAGRWEIVRPRRRPARDLDVQRRLATRETVVLQQSLADRRDALERAVHRPRDAQLTQSSLEALLVARGLEQLAAHRPPDFIDAVAENETAIERRDRCLTTVQKPAVEIDEHPQAYSITPDPYRGTKALSVGRSTRYAPRSTANARRVSPPSP